MLVRMLFALISVGTLGGSVGGVPLIEAKEPTFSPSHTWVRLLVPRFQSELDQLYELRRTDLEESIPETKKHIEYFLKKMRAPKLVEELREQLAKESAELVEIRIKLLLSAVSRFPANEEEELSLLVSGMKKRGEEVPFIWEQRLAKLRCPTAPPPAVPK